MFANKTTFSGITEKLLIRKPNLLQKLFKKFAILTFSISSKAQRFELATFIKTFPKIPRKLSESTIETASK